MTQPTNLRDPIFRFDSAEPFLPIAVESIEAVPATLVGADGTDSGEPARLDSLPAGGGRMNFPPDPEKQEKHLRPRFGNAGYRRGLEAGGLHWEQYWLWYLYNPKQELVTGDHEGDWEFVQVGYGGDDPVCMTTSRHHSGGARMWWEIEQLGGRPVIYVALGSHANYFDRQHDETGIWDKADGVGAELDSIEWREFGDWAEWPGLWGNSTGAGRSPDSPGCQGDRWKHPQVYHSKSRAEH